MLWALQHLIQNRPTYSAIQEFLNYYHNTYGSFSKFPPHIGSAFSFKKRVNAPHPNIYIAIDLLRKEQSLASIARLRDDMGAPAPKRRKNKVITDECLIKLWQRYDEGFLEIPSFLKAAGLRYISKTTKTLNIDSSLFSVNGIFIEILFLLIIYWLSQLVFIYCFLFRRYNQRTVNPHEERLSFFEKKTIKIEKQSLESKSSGGKSCKPSN
ncbi:unnamed protein product [Rotaria magnacalcarata]|uniref:Uncharacterized protein n=1 Tax=Rotaria magnacalcarata TaxID=392030 RepID=A0A8S2LUT0_9BILA|nr:unnamed protein product [Rotaria magnacalcarata]